MSAIIAFARQHPRLASWIVLSVGMVVLFLVAARGRGMTALEQVNLSVLCVGVAGLCAWIIGWESE